jgi:serine/threonine protein kinase
MFEKILKADLTFPQFVSKDARHLLSGLLTRDPDRRLGSGKGDAYEIRSHPFFDGLNWDDVSVTDAIYFLALQFFASSISIFWMIFVLFINLFCCCFVYSPSFF